jgi:hypothetical protein
MKTIKYIVIGVMLTGLSSCMVQKNHYASKRYRDNPYDRYVLSGNSYTHSRPPIN